MNVQDAPLVLVSADRLDEVLELSRSALDLLPPGNDRLQSALRAAIAEIRVRSVVEP